MIPCLHFIFTQQFEILVTALHSEKGDCIVTVVNTEMLVQQVESCLPVAMYFCILVQLQYVLKMFFSLLNFSLLQQNYHLVWISFIQFLERHYMNLQQLQQFYKVTLIQRELWTKFLVKVTNTLIKQSKQIPPGPISTCSFVV